MFPSYIFETVQVKKTSYLGTVNMKLIYRCICKIVGSNY